MVKNLLSLFIALALIAGLSFTEEHYVRHSFQDLTAVLEITYDKAVRGIATEEDGMAMQAFWKKKKERLHVFIPHNDIREMDLWISECVHYLALKDHEEARAKLEVLIDYAETIPNTYRFRLENLM